MPSLSLYHGSDRLFSKFDQSKSRIKNDFWGGGVAYLTNNMEVAKQYAKAMEKKSRTGNFVLYHVKLNVSKIFDEDSEFTGRELLNIVKRVDTEKFCRGAGLLKYGSDKFNVLSMVESGSTTLTGKQVFLGLSNGMVDTAKAREHLKKLGYQALRYNGGQMGINLSKVHHDVFIAYDANDITITDRELIK